MSKKQQINIQINDVPEEVLPQVIDRIQQAIKAILEEYGAEGVKCEKGASEIKF